ncbi:MAG: EF-P lysine aminoacylase EpmA [Steroidobacteraceae bacterium]
MTADWRPTATRSALEQRARLLQTIRAFFAARAVLEVETPALVRAGVTDPNLGSITALSGGAGVTLPFYLHTSPEYAMKRLLASGSGDIYQICKVYRANERGKLHNPEFTLLEWYRVGVSLDTLMAEVAELVNAVLRASATTTIAAPGRPIEYVTYQDALRQHAGIDPLEGSPCDWAATARAAGLSMASIETAAPDALLDFLVGTRVGPRLGRDRLTFLHRYPRSQAALARLDPLDARVALRFELYADGVELANGFHELADADEQRARFDADNRARQRLGLPVVTADAALIAALEHGLPDCCGVALGLDRALMIASGSANIDDVLSFPIERA